MTHIDFLRDLSRPISGVGDVNVVRPDEGELSTIDREHATYYVTPPLFWIPWEAKADSPDKLRAEEGIGTALWDSVVQRAREQGCRRLRVDCESANIFGGNFWLKHFAPVSYAVQRCVDTRIRKGSLT